MTNREKPATSTDPWSRIDQLDDSLLDGIVARLEARAKYGPFANMLREYLEAMEIDGKREVLDLGTGTGVIARTIAARAGFSGKVLGIDLSPQLVAAAEQLAGQEGAGGKVSFTAGDTRSLELENDRFDAVIAHTLVSHVPDPLSVMREMVRVLKPGGMAGIFDGDFASKTFAQEDPLSAKQTDDLINGIQTANPYVMRQMPRLLKQVGLELVAFFSYVLAEVGKADFWASSIQNNRKLIPQSGAMTQDEAESWADTIKQSSDDGVFFGASNYYTYVARKA